MESNTIKACLTVLVSLSLAACGGGGGGGGTPPPTNSAPTISGSPADSVTVGERYSFTPTASDPDGDALTFSIENSPIWATFDTTTGTLSGDPTAGNVGSIDDIVISVSDGRLSDSLSTFSIAVMPEKIGRENFTPMGDVTPTPNGYQSDGDLVLSTAEHEQQFTNASLTLVFDENDELDLMNGETDLPIRLSENVTVAGNVRAVVQTMTGREINEDETFGIRLVDDTKYFVFYVGTSVDLVIADRSNPADVETITISTPAAGEILLISDPTDTFLYDYASTPLVGARGKGESDNGLIPFEPVLPFEELDSFNGHQIEKASVGVGTKYVDFFEVTGTAVVRNPQFADINWDDVFESDIEFRAGLNGDLDFALSIVGFGLFSFDLAETSTTLDIGFDRQQIAMALEIAPDQALFPDPYNMGPSSTSTGSGYINGDGSYGIFLDSTWGVTLPEASVSGLLSLENDVVTLAGTVDEDGESLSVSLSFADNETTGRVEFPERYSANINSLVSDAVDRQLAEVEQTQQDLEQATADYEFEVSLRGLRESLPVMMDQAIATLNAIPGNARTDARSRALSYMRNTCVDLLVGEVCLDDVADENSIANNAGTEAYNEAAAAIVQPRAAMQDLKARALEEDDESLRAALQAALESAYNNRRVTISASYSYRFGSPINKTYTVYNRTWTETVLSPADASDVQTAADNAFRIQETSDIRVSTQQILDELPTEEVLNRVKEDVDAGTAAIPTVDGLGYVAANDRYEPFVTIDGEDRPVEINVLRPSDVESGVSDLLRDILVDEEEQD